MEKCDKTVKRGIHMIVAEPDDSEDNIADKLRTGIKQLTGDVEQEPGDDPLATTTLPTLICYHVAHSGQSREAAMYNAVPFRKDHHDRLIRGALHASRTHGKATEILKMDVYGVGRRKGWKSLPNSKCVHLESTNQPEQVNTMNSCVKK